MEFKSLRRQYKRLKPEIDKAIGEVLEQGQFIGGEQVRRLEEQLARYVGVQHCATCGNGTDALVLLLKALGIGPGDVVLAPAFTFFATAEAVSLAGATPCFVDVDFPTGNISPMALEQVLERQPWEKWGTAKAILAVDLFGLPPEYDIIDQIAKKHNLLLAEDCAQGFGGSFDGEQNGSFGSGAATSFFPAKPLGCYGDGGAIFTNQKEVAGLVKSLRCHGKGENKYENLRIGQNSRLDAIQAAVLQVKLAAYGGEAAAVERIAHYYTQQLQGWVVTPPWPQNRVSAWAQYTIVLPGQEARDGLQRFLQEKGIPTQVYYPTPLHLQKAYRFLGGRLGDCPQAEQLSRRGLSLPIYPDLLPEEEEAVCAAVKEYCRKRKLRASI